MKRWLIRIFLVLGVLVLGLVVTGIVLHEARPIATPDPAADTLAHRLQTAVNIDGWRSLEAVSWDFGGRHQLLWDKKRGYVRVRWDDVEVVRAVDTAKGVVTRGGKPVEGAEKGELLELAHKYFINDSFWLYPFKTFFDKDVIRAVATNADGQKGLLIQYGSGGVTPGDSYLLHLSEDGLPHAWQMWVSIIPVGGVRASWGGWETKAGIPFATTHEMGPITLVLSDLKAGTLAEIEPGADPFAALR